MKEYNQVHSEVSIVYVATKPQMNILSMQKHLFKFIKKFSLHM